MENSIRKETIVQDLIKSTHGKLDGYLKVGLQAAKEEPEFLAHLIAWNRIKGQIRDSKTALPVIAMNQPYKIRGMAGELTDNALAHLALLSPRDLVKAFKFALETRQIDGLIVAGEKSQITRHPYGMRAIRRMVTQYLRVRESNLGWFERTALQHRNSLKTLYALTHTKPSALADLIVMKGQNKSGVFFVVSQLSKMSPDEAAGAILQHRLPFLVSRGALGKNVNEVPVLLALMQRMSATELITNSKWLEKHGVKTIPALRGAYAEATLKAGKVGHVNLFKTSKAAAAIAVEEEPEQERGFSDKLRNVQEKQIEAAKAASGGIDGNWLVLGDKSGSMQAAIEMSKNIAATLAKMVKGKVYLVFFDSQPRRIDVTGKTYDDILKLTMGVVAQGGTSIGVGLDSIMEENINIDGIAIVSDAAENNNPKFSDVYARYCQKFDKRPPVYLYLLDGRDNPQWVSLFLRRQDKDQIPGQVFDLRGKQVDYYALPNLIQTMRVNRYSLIQEIMDTPLLTLEGVLAQKNEFSPVGAR